MQNKRIENSKVKDEIDNYIDRNGVMKTIAGVPVPVVGGLWKNDNNR